MRYILRPPTFKATARRLMRVLGAERTVRVYDGQTRRCDWNQDLFLAFPKPELVDNAPSNYHEMRALYEATKYDQRKWLHSQRLPIPYTVGIHNQPIGEGLNFSSFPDFVVRPLRHTQGAGYRTTRHPTDFDPRHEYISQIYPKRWEYRVILFKGKPVITLLKSDTDHLTYLEPWNHANGSFFTTVHDPSNDRLRWTTVYHDLSQCPTLTSLHMVGVDILLPDRHQLGLRRTPYVICELNFFPSISIPANLEVIRHYALHRP